MPGPPGRGTSRTAWGSAAFKHDKRSTRCDAGGGAQPARVQDSAVPAGPAKPVPWVATRVARHSADSATRDQVGKNIEQLAAEPQDLWCQRRNPSRFWKRVPPGRGGAARQAVASSIHFRQPGSTQWHTRMAACQALVLNDRVPAETGSVPGPGCRRLFWRSRPPWYRPPLCGTLSARQRADGHRFSGAGGDQRR